MKRDFNWLWIKIHIHTCTLKSKTVCRLCFIFALGVKYVPECSCLLRLSDVCIWCSAHNSAYGNTLWTQIMLSLIFILINSILSLIIRRCYLEDGASKGAWLNRSSIIFAGGDKWSVDPRVSISTLNKRDYSLQIQNVDVTDDGPYTCSVQTQHTPRTMQVHLTVQGMHFHNCYIVKNYA